MQARSERLTLLFAAAGHGLMHMLTAFFFVIVLALETEWQQPYHELVKLWTLGALLVGLCALPAGWLADRWSAPGMMVVMFLGMGFACIGCALADGPLSLAAALATLGVFAAIYHPVGIPWIVRNARARGRALGINGIFGGFGVGAAGLVTGVLVDLAGWRAAFAAPGLLCLVFGVALAGCLHRGWLSDAPAQRTDAVEPSGANMLRGFLLLLVTMFTLGFVYQASQAGFPKLFDLRLGQRLGDGAFGVGLVVSIVYSLAALMQLAGGYLADRYPLERVYVGSFLLLAPTLFIVAAASGLPLVAVATLSVLLTTAALPAENMLLARFAPQRHQSLAFGLKFVLAFGTAPLAIAFIARMTALGGDLFAAFIVLALLALLAVLAALALPRAAVVAVPDGAR